LPDYEPAGISAITEAELRNSAWRNGHWNLYEPISLDLADAGTILEKANPWLGKETSLSASSEDSSIYLLRGTPHREGLETAFNRAVTRRRARSRISRRSLRRKPAQRNDRTRRSAGSDAPSRVVGWSAGSWRTNEKASN